MLALALAPLFAIAQELERVEPLFWWTGMEVQELQIMVYGENISECRPSIDYPGVTLKKSISVDSPNYLFIYLNISPEAEAGTFPITFSRRVGRKVKEIVSYDYTLRERRPGSKEREGYLPSDAIYLITPDRFANGNPDNDNVEGMVDKAKRGDLEAGRQGGDLKGISDHLGYIKDMGFTAVWLNPLLENAMAQYSYHGYSTTDFYSVDPRFGTNEEYRALSEAASKQGIKMIMDVIVNHIGTGHWWMKDLPTKDWINEVIPGEYVGTNHVRTTLRDPYVSEYDKKRFTDGWFVPDMPDMNQRNPLLADYLKQNAVWWIEYLDLSGIRMDTYPYSDMHFMAQWTERLCREYPNFKVVGEEWTTNPAILATWQKGKVNADGYKSYLSGLLDFPLQNAVTQSLTKPDVWEAGLPELYVAISNDFQYPAPFDHIIFPDNHDMDRIFTQLKGDYNLYRNAIAFFATMRGTPQFYYGTEILMSNSIPGNHGSIRECFPGGWAGDKVNAFTGEGLSDQAKEAQSFMRKLLNWRKGSKAIAEGKLKQFYPSESVFVYFRYTDDELVMVLLNKNDKAISLATDRFAEILDKGRTGTNVLTGEAITIGDSIEVAPYAPIIIECK